MALDLEVHHLAHHENAYRHPHAGDAQNEVAGAGGEQRHDVGGAGKIDEEGDDERQRADDGRVGGVSADPRYLVAG